MRTINSNLFHLVADAVLSIHEIVTAVTVRRPTLTREINCRQSRVRLALDARARYLEPATITTS